MRSSLITIHSILRLSLNINIADPVSVIFFRFCVWNGKKPAFLRLDGRSWRYRTIQMNTPSPDLNPQSDPQNPSGLGQTGTRRPPEWTSEQLLVGQLEVLIRHGDEVYRLRATRNGKLILTK